VCTKWSLDVNALHVVSDSGANVKKTMTQLQNVKWRPCFVHNLQLIVRGALGGKEVSDLPKILSKVPVLMLGAL